MAPQTRNHQTSAQGSSSDGRLRRPHEAPSPTAPPSTTTRSAKLQTRALVLFNDAREDLLENDTFILGFFFASLSPPSCLATPTCDNRRGFNTFARPASSTSLSRARARGLRHTRLLRRSSFSSGAASICIFVGAGRFTIRSVAAHLGEY
ncbi:hypothetical protein LX32DRAFT_653139 [Colletotrichum zoysiae]|uniref:Uncharacterized protein n=1 Tax=Colletotrichum zoysiae TaxID=1216348 RepID=A0AAD9M4R6_9PEZI|nr:hypothetical protein LX32DRAFT_653139 [Colletotrichum zoysiae]